MQYDRKKKFIVNTVYFVILISILYILFKYALSLVSPFVFALIFAYVLEKPAKFVAKISHIPKKLVSVVFVLVFYATIGLVLSFAGIKIIAVLTDVISGFPVIYEEQLAPFLLDRFDAIEAAIFRLDPAVVTMINQGFDQFVNSIGDNISNISLSLVGAVSNIASSLPLFLIKVLLMVISTFFIASDYENLSAFVQRQFSGKSNDILLRTKHYLIDTLLVVVRSYAIIMTITFIELSVGLSIINVPNAILIALIIAMLDILPVLGTGGIMLPWTIISFIQGNYKLGIGLIVIYLFVTVVRNILEPKIVGSQLGLHPVVTLMSMFVGVNLFGVLGLFGLPITLSLLKHLNDTGAIKLYNR
ncbi:MAG TPA: sporulation integral membrane protein YtvI [Clostridiales bacterium UBA8960]|nr:sporulation integral membrane protein YtvI [Clostridiales bacterium UBA8960]